MFKIETSGRRLVRLKKERFSDLNFRERDHLQEWIAGMPDVLGEELLIIQKEFDDFADTRERLDLLKWFSNYPTVRPKKLGSCARLKGRSLSSILYDFRNKRLASVCEGA